MEYDNTSVVSSVNSVSPAALTATTVGAIIDTLGFESGVFLAHVGTALVGGGFDVTFDESDVVTFGGEETAVPAANILGGFSDAIAIQMVATDADRTFRCGLINKKRFVRATLTETGTVSGGIVGATMLLGHPETGPVAVSNAA